MRRVCRLLVRYGYFPLMFVGLNGIALGLIFARPTPGALAVGLLALVAVALVASFTAERSLPYEPAWNVDHGDLGRDLAHFVVNESMSLGPLLVVPLIAAAAPAPPDSAWPVEWPVPLQFLLALLVFDLGQNLFHWASHMWSPLWRLHAIHHSVERMYGLNGIMKHPLYQALAGAASMAPLVLLGMPDSYALAIAFCTIVQLLLQHANVDYRTGVVRRICATAEVHRFHHLRGVEGNVNFALFFAFWDHLLGHAYDAPRRLRTADIGLDYVDYPVGYLAQLLAPLRSFDEHPPTGA